MDPVTTFLDAFNRADFDAMQAVLAEDLVATTTTDDGGESRSTGSHAYVGAVRDMVRRSGAAYTVTTTQAPVVLEPDLLMVMLEIRATRGDRALHNFSAQVFRLRDGLISEIRMADAKPAESAAFWA